MARVVAGAYDALVNGLAVLGAVILVGMSLWVTYDVLMRYIFVQPTIWADDLSEYGLLWATFLGAPWVLRREGHVRIELVTERLSPQRRRAIAVVVSIVGALVCAVFAWQTALTTVDFLQRNLMVARSWRIPLWLPYAAIPIGSALLCVEFVLRAGRLARDGHATLTGRSGHI